MAKSRKDAVNEAKLDITLKEDCYLSDRLTMLKQILDTQSDKGSRDERLVKFIDKIYTDGFEDGANEADSQTGFGLYS